MLWEIPGSWFGLSSVPRLGVNVMGDSKLMGLAWILHLHRGGAMLWEIVDWIRLGYRRSASS